MGIGWANLHNARRAATPLLNIVGDHATYHAQYDAPLASDVTGLARTVSGWVHSSVSPRTVAADGAAVMLSIDGKAVGTQTAKEIAVGDTATLTFPWKLTTLQPVITAMADYNGTILESDETNNAMTSNATFSAPPAPTKKPALPITRQPCAFAI